LKGDTWPPSYRKFGVKGWMLKWFHDFINLSFCATKVENETLEYKQNRRLPHGTVTSITLLNVMVVDLPGQVDEIKKVKSALCS
jgi:hypothetical protein